MLREVQELGRGGCSRHWPRYPQRCLLFWGRVAGGRKRCATRHAAGVQWGVCNPAQPAGTAGHVPCVRPAPRSVPAFGTLRSGSARWQRCLLPAGAPRPPETPRGMQPGPGQARAAGCHPPPAPRPVAVPRLAHLVPCTSPCPPSSHARGGRRILRHCPPQNAPKLPRAPRPAPVHAVCPPGLWPGRQPRSVLPQVLLTFSLPPNFSWT